MQPTLRLWSKFKKQIKSRKRIVGHKLKSFLSELMFENNECVFAGFDALLMLLRKKNLVYCYRK